MQIFAKSINGEIIEIEVTKCDKIFDLKKQIEKLVGLSSTEQKLVYQARILEDDKTVHFYRISEKSVINVVDRLRNGMQISVHTLDGRSVDVDVTKNDMIIDVKKKVRKKLGLLSDGQVLIYLGQILDNSETVEYYRFVEKCVVNVVTREIVNVNIKRTVGEIVKLEVTSGDRIIDMKKKIQEMTGLSVYDQRLIYRDNILCNGLTVGDYQIAENGVVRVESRNGVMKHQGLCLIISNENFTQISPSRGATKDNEKKIRETFEPLGFKMKTHRDVEFDAMEAIIKDTKDEVQAENYMLMVFVLSRGDKCSLLTTDGRSYPYQNVWSPFTNDNLSKLAGKPKLFFFVFEKESSSFTLDSPLSPESQVLLAPCSLTPKDFFLAYSSSKSTKSSRDTDNIAVYVDCLCSVVTNNPAWSISDMHQEVQRRLALKSFQNDGLVEPYCTNHLTEHAYLLKDDY